MNNPMKIGNLYNHALATNSVRRNVSRNAHEKTSFQQILDQKILKFSHHAQARLEQRGIRLEDSQLEKLEGAIEQAAAKGAKDSLLLMNDMAFIVNVKSRTVVTALDHASMENNVFTQIDSAVVVR